MPGIAATINGRKIPLDYLAEECMARNGAEAIGGLINRRLLEQALGRRGLKVTQKEIDAEIEEAAMKMRPPKNGQVDVEGWIQQVTSEPGVTKELYIRDAVWPSVALKLLVSEGIKVTEEDLKKAWEANYGPRVRCKAIVVDDLRTAKKVWQLARDNAGEENFGNLSEEYSSDASVRALKGDVPPIQLHSGRPNLEKEAFNLREGEMSGVIQADDKFVILLCTGWTEPQNLEMEAVRNLLFNHVHAQKLRRAMADEFQRLQSTAKIVNYLSPKPSARTAAYPDPRAVR
jgi:parvulin-like peptidyl-prolyl isomerase